MMRISILSILEKLSKNSLSKNCKTISIVIRGITRRSSQMKMRVRKNLRKRMMIRLQRMPKTKNLPNSTIYLLIKWLLLIQWIGQFHQRTMIRWWREMSSLTFWRIRWKIKPSVASCFKHLWWMKHLIFWWTYLTKLIKNAPKSVNNTLTRQNLVVKISRRNSPNIQKSKTISKYWNSLKRTNWSRTQTFDWKSSKAIWLK